MDYSANNKDEFLWGGERKAFRPEGFLINAIVISQTVGKGDGRLINHIN